MRSILKSCKVVLLDNALAAGSTTNSRGSKVVDMSGFDSILTLTTLSDTSTAVTVTAQTAASTSAADFVTVTHNATAITASSTVKNGVVALECQQVNNRYFRITQSSTVAQVTGGTVAILYNAKAQPTTSDSSDVLASYVGVVTS